jgi:hypothetical protein
VGPHHHRDPEFERNEIHEIVQPRTGWVPDHQTGGKMDRFRSVLDHLLRSFFDVPAGAASTAGIPDDLHGVFLRID